MDKDAIRVLAFIEATTVTGPAKNLIEFARLAAEPGPHAKVNLDLVTYERTRTSEQNAFRSVVEHNRINLDVISERFPFDLRILPQLHRIVEKKKPDIIQTHNTKSHFLIRLAGLHRRYPWVAFHHGYTWRDLRDRTYHLFDRYSLRAASQVVTVCQPFVSQLKAVGVEPRRITVLHNSVKPFIPSSREDVTALRSSLGISNDAFVVLSVGRLSSEKGHADLLEAAAQAHRKIGSRFYLVIVGEGPERESILFRAKELGISNCLILTGHQPHLAPYYSMAGVLALPSHSEGSPNVLLEAMAARLPAVATKVGGVPEIAIDGETALLVEKRNPAALAKALVHLILDESLRRRLGSAAQTVATRYDPAHYCSSMIQLYSKVLSPGEFDAKSERDKEKQCHAFR